MANDVNNPTPQELISLIRSLIIDNNLNIITPKLMRTVLESIVLTLRSDNPQAVSAIEPLIFSAFTNEFSIQKSSITQDGYLSKEDFLAFLEAAEEGVQSISAINPLAIDNSNPAEPVLNVATPEVATELAYNAETAAKSYTDTQLLNKADLVAGKVPQSQLPSYVDDVLEGYLLSNVFYLESSHTTVIPAEAGKIYIDLTSGQSSKEYRWGGSAYIQITNGLIASTADVPENSGFLYFTAARVLATVLAGLNTALTGTVVSTDTVLQAFGKIQKQISDNVAALLLKEVTANKSDNSALGTSTSLYPTQRAVKDYFDTNVAKKSYTITFKFAGGATGNYNALNLFLASNTFSNSTSATSLAAVTLTSVAGSSGVFIAPKNCKVTFVGIEGNVGVSDFALMTRLRTSGGAFSNKVDILEVIGSNFSGFKLDVVGGVTVTKNYELVPLLKVASGSYGTITIILEDI